MANATVKYGTYNPNSFFTPNTEENMFDFIVYGGKGVKRNATPSAVGEDVHTFVAAKGDNLVWGQGNAVASVFNRLPWRIDNMRTRFDNNPHTSYFSNTLSGVNVYEWWMELVQFPGQDSERFSSTFPYVADGGDNDLRLLSPDLSVGGGALTKFVRTIIRVKKNADKTAQLWVNGQYRGFVTGAEDYPQTIASVGADTNSTEFDFGALYIKRGSTFSDTVAINTIFPSLMAKFNSGSIPARLMLNNITITKSGSTYGVTYTQQKNDSLVYKAPNLWAYRWSTILYVTGDGGNYAIQPLLSTSAAPTDAEFEAARQAWNSANPSNQISTGFAKKVRIMPITTGDLSWRYMSGGIQTI